MKYESKTELIEDVGRQRLLLLETLEGIPEAQRTEPGVWGDGWTVVDLVAHLDAWHRLFLVWFRQGAAGQVPDLPAPGYKWNETPRLNRDIQAQHRGDSYQAALANFEASSDEVDALLQQLSEPELLEAGHFAWTGKNALVTYAGANTASHYRFGLKVLKRWLRQRT